tara:strand:+ start:10716 stop:11246 length:531 start_codon:yes stop_codon:yes gene_type:complete
MIMDIIYKSPQKQQGATLIIGLIMLILLTIIGLAAMDMTTVDVKVVANAKDRQLAFIGAESSLFSAGQVIRDFDDDIDDSIDEFVDDAFAIEGYNWWQNKANWELKPVAGTNIEAEYQIETPVVQSDGIGVNMDNTGPSDNYGFYPTTAKSIGPGQAVVVLQSHFVKKLYFAPKPK